MTIERFAEVSDGKRYHGLQRDPMGEWCRFDDVSKQYHNLLINRCIDFGVPHHQVVGTFNHLVDTLIKAVEQRTADRANKRGMFAPEVIKAAEELTSRFPHSPDFEEQVFRTAQVIQEVVDKQNPLGSGIGIDGKAICK